jgi:hypothetical protein
MRRLISLQRAGYVTFSRGSTPLFALTPKGARRVGAPLPRRVHPRHLAHHLATLGAIEDYRARLNAIGGRLVPTQLPDGQVAEYQLEFHVQAFERAGAGTQAGTEYNASPDAIVFAELPDPKTDELRLHRVALEYFTASYSDAQIASKAVFARQFDAVHQVADCVTTAARVAAITGAVCVPARHGRPL